MPQIEALMAVAYGLAVGASLVAVMAKAAGDHRAASGAFVFMLLCLAVLKAADWLEANG